MPTEVRLPITNLSVNVFINSRAIMQRELRVQGGSGEQSFKTYQLKILIHTIIVEQIDFVEISAK